MKSIVFLILSMCIVNAFANSSISNKNEPKTLLKPTKKNHHCTNLFVRISNIHTKKSFDTVEKNLKSLPRFCKKELHSVTADAVLYKLILNEPCNHVRARLQKIYGPPIGQIKDGITEYRLHS